MVCAAFISNDIDFRYPLDDCQCHFHDDRSWKRCRPER